MLNLNELFPVVEFDPLMRTKRIEWTVEGVWQEGKINGMMAPEKSGKSRLLAWLIAGLMAGIPPLGLSIRSPQRLLYLAGEETIEDVTARLVSYAELMGVGLNNSLPIDFISAAGMRLETAQYRSWLEGKLANYDMVVIDPLRRVHGGDEDSNSEMAAFHNSLRQWSNNLGITFVLVHHTGKLNEEANMDRIATWARGNTDFAAIVDTATFVHRFDRDRIRLLRAGRFPPLDPLQIMDGSDAKGFWLQGQGGK